LPSDQSNIHSDYDFTQSDYKIGQSRIQAFRNLFSDWTTSDDPESESPMQDSNVSEVPQPILFVSDPYYSQPGAFRVDGPVAFRVDESYVMTQTRTRYTPKPVPVAGRYTQSRLEQGFLSEEQGGYIVDIAVEAALVSKKDLLVGVIVEPADRHKEHSFASLLFLAAVVLAAGLGVDLGIALSGSDGSATPSAVTSLVLLSVLLVLLAPRQLSLSFLSAPPKSSRDLGESLKESLLRESLLRDLLGKCRESQGKSLTDAPQVICLVCESLSKAMSESLQQLLPTSNRLRVDFYILNKIEHYLYSM
jgi:hypothetical protein